MSAIDDISFYRGDKCNLVNQYYILILILILFQTILNFIQNKDTN